MRPVSPPCDKLRDGAGGRAQAEEHARHFRAEHGGVSHSLFISEQDAAQVGGGAKQKPRQPTATATVRPPFCASHYNRTGLLFTNAMFSSFSRASGSKPEHQNFRSRKSDMGQLEIGSKNVSFVVTVSHPSNRPSRGSDTPHTVREAKEGV